MAGYFDMMGNINSMNQNFNALGDLGRFMLQKRGMDMQQKQQDYLNQQADQKRKVEEDRMKQISQIIQGTQTRRRTVAEPYTVTEQAEVFDPTGEMANAPDIAAFMQRPDAVYDRNAAGATVPSMAGRGDFSGMAGKVPEQSFPDIAAFMQGVPGAGPMAKTVTEPAQVDPLELLRSMPVSPVEAVRKRTETRERTEMRERTEDVPNENWLGDAARGVAGIDPELGMEMAKVSRVEKDAAKSEKLGMAMESVNGALNAMYAPMAEGVDENTAKSETDKRFVDYVTAMNKYNALAGKPLVDVNGIEMQRQKQDLWKYQIENNLKMARGRASAQAEKEASDKAMKERELKLKEDEFRHEKTMDWSNLGLERQKLESAKASGKYNDGQLNSAAFAVRMAKAIPVVIENESRLSGEDRTLLALGKSPISDSGRLYYNALRDVAMAQLRKESGAAISDGEMKLMFERYGRSLLDGDSVRAQKIEALKTDLQNMKALSNGAYEFITARQAGAGKAANGGANATSAVPGRKRVDLTTIDDNADF